MANFEGTKISGTKVLKRSALANSKGLENYSGFIFEDDELDKEKETREKRTERLFDVNQKGNISFSLPSDMQPLRIGQTLICLSLLTEGVRLALTADYASIEELALKVADPALWTTNEEKYATKITRLEMHSPLTGDFLIILGLGSLILPIIKYGAPYLDSFLTHKDRMLEINQKHMIEREKLALERDKFEFQKGQILASKGSEAQAAFKKATNRTYADLPEETKKTAQELTSQLAGKVDNHEERLQYGVEIVLRTFDKLRALLRDVDAELEINDTNIDLKTEEPEDTDEEPNDPERD